MKNSLPGFYILSASTQVLYLVSMHLPVYKLLYLEWVYKFAKS